MQIQKYKNETPHPKVAIGRGGVVIQYTQNQLTLISSNLIEDDAWNQSVIENQQFHSKPCLVLVKQYYFGIQYTEN